MNIFTNFIKSKKDETSEGKKISETSPKEPQNKQPKANDGVYNPDSQIKIYGGSFNQDSETRTYSVAYDQDKDPFDYSDLKDRKYPKSQKTTKIFFKKLVKKNLTIIMIEDSAELANQKDLVFKIVKSFIGSDLAIIVSYGEVVKQSDMIRSTDFINIDTYLSENATDKVCLYDALAEVESLVKKKYFEITETDTERIMIDKLEIVGIGSCKDNCSKHSKESGIEAFCKITERYNFLTKYFCFTQDSFMNAAEIGFRSIGAISKKY